jgi:hypothetical protein
MGALRLGLMLAAFDIARRGSGHIEPAWERGVAALDGGQQHAIAVAPVDRGLRVYRREVVGQVARGLRVAEHRRERIDAAGRRFDHDQLKMAVSLVHRLKPLLWRTDVHILGLEKRSETERHGRKLCRVARDHIAQIVPYGRVSVPPRGTEWQTMACDRCLDRARPIVRRRVLPRR